MQAKVFHPFVKLVWGTEGEARDKAVLLVKEDLGGTDDDAFDWGVEDNLSGDGIEGHLVMWFVLVEVKYRDWEDEISDRNREGVCRGVRCG